MKEYEIKFMQNTGFDFVRKIFFFFSGFCAGAGCSYIRFDRVLSFFAFFCAFLFHIFNIKLKVESKMYKWNNRRFVYLIGFPCSICLLGFSIASFFENCIEGAIGCAVMSVITFLLTLYNKKFAKKIPVNEKN